MGAGQREREGEGENWFQERGPELALSGSQAIPASSLPLLYVTSTLLSSLPSATA